MTEEVWQKVTTIQPREKSGRRRIVITFISDLTPPTNTFSPPSPIPDPQKAETFEEEKKLIVLAWSFLIFIFRPSLWVGWLAGPFFVIRKTCFRGCSCLYSMQPFSRLEIGEAS